MSDVKFNHLLIGTVNNLNDVSINAIWRTSSQRIFRAFDLGQFFGSQPDQEPEDEFHLL